MRRRLPQPSRLPSVATNVLAHAFVAIYADFAVLEARIVGRAAPRESVIYVRHAGETGGDYRATLEASHVKLKHRISSSLKSVLDRVSAGVLLFLLAPVLLAIAVAIKLSSPGPVLFRQVRVGKFGKPFVLYKFRTMYQHIDDKIHRDYVTSMLRASPAPADAERGIFKLTRDPRITRVGRFLRRSSLDELPQLVNVLVGDMSMVGPRPVQSYEAELFQPTYQARFAVKPGITGLWQAYGGRSDLTMQQALDLDVEYVEQWSLWLDVVTLARTVIAIFSGKGNYT
jgi:lipopolysaccharide/colanic/teichoic acid biosynthesis glycosyltransferase